MSDSTRLDSARYDSARLGFSRLCSVRYGLVRLGDAHLETVTNHVIKFVITCYLARCRLAVYEASDANRAGVLSSLCFRGGL